MVGGGGGNDGVMVVGGNDWVLVLIVAVGMWSLWRNLHDYFIHSLLKHFSVDKVNI